MPWGGKGCRQAFARGPEPGDRHRVSSRVWLTIEGKASIRSNRSPLFSVVPTEIEPVGGEVAHDPERDAGALGATVLLAGGEDGYARRQPDLRGRFDAALVRIAP